MLDVMTFVFATDDQSLFVFPTPATACSHAEGVDVEDGLYLFFDDTGRPLKPVFSTPNERARFSVVSGVYSLDSERAETSSSLFDILPQVASVEGELASIEAVRQHLTNR
jgi:hypothetical protein